MRVRIGVAVLAAFALVASALAGCARYGSAGGGFIGLDEKDNGHTVRVARGYGVGVVLHSIYWTFAALAGTDVLRPVGAPSVAALPPGSRCVPGGGCGTVTATFTAAGTGVVQVRASRTSCGEAMGCAPEQASFAVTIVVGDTTPPAGLPRTGRHRAGRFQRRIDEPGRAREDMTASVMLAVGGQGRHQHGGRHQNGRLGRVGVRREERFIRPRPWA